MALSAASCSADADSPSADGGAPSAVTVSSCGQELSFRQPPERVITLDQSSTETLLALGLGDRMVGTSNIKTKIAPEYQAAYDRIPVLNPKIATGEQVRAATPDLVVSSFTDLFTKDRVGTRDELGLLGLPSYISAVDCPEDSQTAMTPFDLLFKDYETLGKVFGVEDTAAKLIAEQRTVVDQAGKTREALGGRQPSVLWLYSAFKGTPYVGGGTGIPSAMGRQLGARNVFDDIAEDWPEVSWEEIAKRDPDFIIVADLSERGRPGDGAEEKIAMMKENPAVSQLAALRDNRIVRVPGIEMDPSVRSVNSLRVVADGMRELGYVR